MSKPKMYGINKAADNKWKQRADVLWDRKKKRQHILTTDPKSFVEAARNRGDKT